ncbi:diphosphate--fructose-6-phosphate 1-phosphotransferase [Bacillus taeanensis]|uniref:Pyrophosphate--fructose 6-phosphate 1-phosphotransferase n=1 Tax=Bacillus taeanensis TaxID=273032 RepID=A0A366XT94_9BACI|nr:diphosphate--fructose-6-phosphate 1-phosphotransferase [Bacillus taeanensis]RBW67374.1 hypothetical protein DS031_22500 [Bacillus taeanensis]
MKKVAIGQAGGPTAVFNTSLIGFLDHCHAEVYGVLKGYQGLVEGSFIPLEGSMLKKVEQYRSVPGACLGAGRYPMTEEALEKAVNNLRLKGIDTLVFIGGNGTMWTMHQLEKKAKKIGYDLQVIGIPKTVDNDLAETDHAPGFASAARYVALSVRDISKDLEAMRNFEQVRIIETMGRNVGWLAAASGLLKASESDGPHKIYLPEETLSADQFLNDVKNLVAEFGFASIVVSEGVKLNEGKAVEKAFVNGRSVLGGISKQLSSFVQEELGLMARDELLGMNQRSSQFASSGQDRLEAYEVGKKAAHLISEDISGVMVTIERLQKSYYDYQFGTALLQKVAAGGERSLPKLFRVNQQAFYRWLEPLVGRDVEPFPSMIQRREIHEKKSFRS